MSPPPPQNRMKHQRSSSNWTRKMLVRGGVAPAVDSSSSDDDEFTADISFSGNPMVREAVSYQPLELPLMQQPRWLPGKAVALNFSAALAAIFRFIFPPLQALIPTCQKLSLPAFSSAACVGRRRITGTLFGRRNGRVSFTVQEDPSLEPVLLLELPTPTCHLVKEMSSGTVRILLECERRHRNTTKKKHHHHPSPPLWEEPVWSMSCNGRRSGFAVSRECSESDRRVFRTIQAVSAGAGLIPPPAPPLMESGKGNHGSPSDGVGGGPEVMFMRANFERVVGSKDSEAFYMMSPEGGGWKSSHTSSGPELSIFLLRL